MGRYISPNITRITDGIQNGPVPQNAYFESMVTMDYTIDQLARGISFIGSYYAEMILDQVLDIVVITADNSLIRITNDILIATLQTTFEVYPLVTLTSPGTEISFDNRNQTSANTPTTTMYHTPTINVLGAKSFELTWAGGARPAAELPIVLANDHAYLFRITSNAAGNHVFYEQLITEDVNRNE